MKRAVVAIAWLVACDNNTDPRWELHHDRIIAVRVTPPHLPAGASAAIDAFVTSGEAGVAVQSPTQVTAPSPATSLVTTDGTTWQITAPDDDLIAEARAALGLPDGAPVPVELTTTFEIDNLELVATKLVYFGDAADNPIVGAVTIDGVPPTDSITVPFDTDVQLAIDADPTFTVNWFTSCGSLNDDDNEHAVLLHVHPADRLVGQLAVVVRDTLGGVAWQSWTIMSAAAADDAARTKLAARSARGGQSPPGCARSPSRSC